MGNAEVKSPVVWVDVPCVDLDRAMRFYSSVLAVDLKKEEVPGFSMCVFPHGDRGAGGCLAVMKDAKPSENGPLIYLDCEGRLDEAVGKVEASGGKIVQPKHQIGPHGYRAIVIDSEGNRVALHSK